MRIAIVSDIHGNHTAFEAVLKDLRRASPDLILHGGDLVHGGSNSAEIVDWIRDLDWPGVLGNTDELLFRPESLTEFASGAPRLGSLFATIAEMAAFERALLGEERLDWLRRLPLIQRHDSVALVHGTPASPWRAPSPEATDSELLAAYAELDCDVAVYAHIHRPFVRKVESMTIANTGSVSLSYDGDCRAAYLVVDDSALFIRRVEYNVDREIQALLASNLPHANWIAQTLASAAPQALP